MTGCTCARDRASLKSPWHSFDCPLNANRPRTRLHNCPDCRHYPEETKANG